MTASLDALPPLSAEDLNGLNRSVFEWADSTDTKDWTRLQANLAPELYVDYRPLGLDCWPRMSATDYVARAKDEKFLGNPAITTQHFIGASYYNRTAIDEVEGHHQVRAAHQVHNDETLTSAKMRAIGVSGSTHWYRKIDGVWKFAGIRPNLYWTVQDSMHNFNGVMSIAAGAWTA